MWILVADGLLRALNSAAYFAQGYADDFSILVEGMDLATVCGVMQAALLRVEQKTQLSQRERPKLRVIEYFAVTQGHSK